MKPLLSLSLVTVFSLASACTETERPPEGERACMTTTYAGKDADCGEDFCGKKAYDIQVDYSFPNGFQCTITCELRKTGPNSGGQAFQYAHDGLYLRLVFGEGVFASPRYTSVDLSNSFESGYLTYDAPDGPRDVRLGLSFKKGSEIGAGTNAVVDHVGFEDGKLVFKVHGQTNRGSEGLDWPCPAGQDCNCSYEGDTIALSFDIRSTIEHPL